MLTPDQGQRMIYALCANFSATLGKFVAYFLPNPAIHNSWTAFLPLRGRISLISLRPRQHGVQCLVSFLRSLGCRGFSLKRRRVRLLMCRVIWACELAVAAACMAGVDVRCSALEARGLLSVS
ncbi:unnamed protein product [Lampetra planeri]